MADLLDAQLLHALHVDGRAAFRSIAEVLGVSDQTVARRYARLRSSGRLRIRGQTDAGLADQTQWIVRVQCAANAVAVAQALARRPDTAWINLTSGGAEIVGTVRTRADAEQDNRLLLETLPRTRTVTAMAAHCVLHTFFGNAASVVDKSGPLTADQVERLRPPAGPARHAAPRRGAPPPTPGSARSDRPTGRCWPGSPRTGAPASATWPRRPAGLRARCGAGSPSCGPPACSTSTSTTTRS
jgi:DNA-binding Lrp family transcriptional regulator